MPKCKFIVGLLGPKDRCQVTVPQGHEFCDMHKPKAVELPEQAVKTMIARCVAVLADSKLHGAGAGFEDKKYGGRYYGGDNGNPHVHRYKDGAAHVKVGTDKHPILKQLSKIAPDPAWNTAVAAVRARFRADKTGDVLLAAMCMVLLQFESTMTPEEKLAYVVPVMGASK